MRRQRALKNARSNPAFPALCNFLFERERENNFPSKTRDNVTRARKLYGYIKRGRERSRGDITGYLMRSQRSRKINNVQLLLHSYSPRYYSAHLSSSISLNPAEVYFFSLARARHPLSGARYPRSGRIRRNCTVTG